MRSACGGSYNAGNGLWKTPLETTAAELEQMWRINCAGLLTATQATHFKHKIHHFNAQSIILNAKLVILKHRRSHRG